MSLHSVESGTFDPRTRQCVSISVSYQHSVDSLDTSHLREDTWQHDEVEEDVVAGA